jgi:hypothetical protein
VPRQSDNTLEHKPVLPDLRKFPHLGKKMTFSWEIFPDLYVVNGEFLAASLFIGKYLGNFKIPYVVNGEFIKIFWGISKI